MAKLLLEKIKAANSFKESMQALMDMSEVCDKFGVSPVKVLESGDYYCTRISLEIGEPYQDVLPIVWSIWENWENAK